MTDQKLLNRPCGLPNRISCRRQASGLALREGRAQRRRVAEYCTVASPSKGGTVTDLEQNEEVNVIARYAPWDGLYMVRLTEAFHSMDATLTERPVPLP